MAWVVTFQPAVKHYYEIAVFRGIQRIIISIEIPEEYSKATRL